ncbi:hypothetical protein KAX35_05790, partial [candidate division WOR-3 bacterium]|nr:hypothetical protein [candidate division WOR-3 bacterium]
SGWMECINPPKSGVETKDVYHFRAHLWWTYDGPLDHYELYRKLLKPREGDPTGWWRIYYGSNTSKIDPYDFEEDDAAWYYV